jgi:hypothetical protein
MKTSIPPLTKCQAIRQTTRAATPFPGGWLRGTVVMVEPSRDLLYLRAQETRKKLFIHWTPDTQFAVDGHPGSSADLRSGQRVQIHCRFANEELKADDITIEFSDHAGMPKPNVLSLHPEPRSNQRGGKT